MKHAAIRKLFIIMLVSLAILVMTPAIFAQDQGGFESREYDIGICGGLWLPGSIDIEDVDVDKENGLLIRAIADMYISPKFAVGGYFNYSMFSVSKDSYEADANLYEFGFAFKPRLILSPQTALKPGLNIGYRKSTREKLDIEPSGVETDADGLGINVSIEFQYLLDGGYIFFVDGGFLSQPAGGNDDADVTWAPILYICAGVVF